MAAAHHRGLLHRGPDVPAVRRRSGPSALVGRPTRSTTRPRPTSRRSGPARPASCSPGSTTSTPCSSGSCPFAKWFVGGTLNVSYNCLDRHVEAGRGDKVAYHWEGEPGDTRTITYAELLDEVCRFANVLKGLGVERGDRVGIYMPMIPELPVAMLACTRIGAAHSVHLRRLLARLDHRPGQRRRGQGHRHRRRRLPARARPRRSSPTSTRPSPPPRRSPRVVVVQRTGGDVDMVDGRDHWYHELMADAVGRLPARAHGQRGPALPALHLGHDGQAQGHHAHHRRLPHPGRVHPQVRVRPAPRRRRLLVRGRHRLGDRPQLHRLRARSPTGPRRCIYEGTPDTPGQGPAVVDRRALRRDPALHRADRHPHVHEVGRPRSRRATTCRSLRVLGTVGEPINPEAWMWYHTHIGGERCPIVDTWWQTETGGHMITPLPGVTTTKPGSATFPLPGHLGRGGRRPRRAHRARVAATSPSPARGRRCCAASGATPSATSTPTGAPTRAATSPATAPRSTTTATSGCSVGSTT